MEHFFLHKANRGHLASQARILSFLTDTPRERYQQLLQKQPAIMQRVLKTVLASYLGVSRETVSRLGVINNVAFPFFKHVIEVTIQQVRFYHFARHK